MCVCVCVCKCPCLLQSDSHLVLERCSDSTHHCHCEQLVHGAVSMRSHEQQLLLGHLLDQPALKHGRYVAWAKGGGKIYREIQVGIENDEINGIMLFELISVEYGTAKRPPTIILRYSSLLVLHTRC